MFVCAPCLYPVLPGWGVPCGPVCRAHVLAVPRHSLSGCWGVCAFVRLPRLHPAIPGGVMCVCLGFGFVCSPVFSWLGWSGAWSLVCAVFVSRHLLGGRLWRGGVRVLLWEGLVTPLPFRFFFFAGGCRGLSCRDFVVSIAGCPGLGPRAHRCPFPSRSGCAFVCFLFSVPALGECVSVCSVCPLFRWAAALGWVSPVVAG